MGFTEKNFDEVSIKYDVWEDPEFIAMCEDHDNGNFEFPNHEIKLSQPQLDAGYTVEVEGNNRKFNIADLVALQPQFKECKITETFIPPSSTKQDLYWIDELNPEVTSFDVLDSYEVTDKIFDILDDLDFNNKYSDFYDQVFDIIDNVMEEKEKLQDEIEQLKDSLVTYKIGRTPEQEIIVTQPDIQDSETIIRDLKNNLNADFKSITITKNEDKTFNVQTISEIKPEYGLERGIISHEVSVSQDGTSMYYSPELCETITNSARKNLISSEETFKQIFGSKLIDTDSVVQRTDFSPTHYVNIKNNYSATPDFGKETNEKLQEIETITNVSTMNTVTYIRDSLEAAMKPYLYEFNDETTKKAMAEAMEEIYKETFPDSIMNFTYNWDFNKETNMLTGTPVIQEVDIG